MTVAELYKALDTAIPRALSCEWDNDGLMCCPDPERNVSRVLIALDITEEVVEDAIAGGFDVILSHNPIIFKGLKAVDPSNAVARKTIKLIRNGITAMSFHTRLDALKGGVNDVLAARLGLEDVTDFGADAVPIGRIGTLEYPMPLDAFAEQVKLALHVPAVSVADAHRPVYRVAVLGGSGADDVAAAMAAGADTYVSGNLKYNQMVDAPDEGINLIEAGHFYTEQPICYHLADMIRELDGEIETRVTWSCRIRTI
jgi:dinuclear metal center YbgI/SA1388 family protein